MAGKDSKSGKSATTTSKPDIKKDEILKAEFDYAANSAFQANEDRSKVASFFLVSVGSLAATILSVDSLNLSSNSVIGLAGLFVVLTLLGAMTILQLARLRQAWVESAKAMNRIKDHYIDMYKEPENSPNSFKGAFRWRTDTIPPTYKPHSISYYTVIEVAFLSGLTFGAAVYFLQTGMGYTDCLWAFTISAAALAFFIELFIYKRLLKD